MTSQSRRLAVLVALAALAFAPMVSGARSADPAAGQVERLDSALLTSMKAGKSLDVKGRYRRLAPVISRAFDLPAMTAFAVGPAWGEFTKAQQRAAIQAFTRLTVASYAANFASYAGETFEVDPNVQVRGPEKVVQTRLIRPGGPVVGLVYRVHRQGGAWKIVDIDFGGISQLSVRRADFATAIAQGGAPALIAHVQSLGEALLK